jgi:hypothetical protein
MLEIFDVGSFVDFQLDRSIDLGEPFQTLRLFWIGSLLYLAGLKMSTETALTMFDQEVAMTSEQNMLMDQLVACAWVLGAARVACLVRYWLRAFFGCVMVALPVCVIGNLGAGVALVRRKHDREEAEALMDAGITGNGNSGAGAAGFSFTGQAKKLDSAQ